jgi:hypothetical protein
MTPEADFVRTRQPGWLPCKASGPTHLKSLRRSNRSSQERQTRYGQPLLARVSTNPVSPDWRKTVAQHAKSEGVRVKTRFLYSALWKMNIPSVFINY